jgi:hypothetical protein
MPCKRASVFIEALLVNLEGVRLPRILGVVFTKWLKRCISSVFFCLNSQVYDEGNTLLHLLCTQGDSHVNVLAELLSMKDRSNAPCFDVNQHNHREGRNVLSSLILHHFLLTKLMAH